MIETRAGGVLLRIWPRKFIIYAFFKCRFHEGGILGYNNSDKEWHFR